MVNPDIIITFKIAAALLEQSMNYDYVHEMSTVASPFTGVFTQTESVQLVTVATQTDTVYTRQGTTSTKFLEMLNRRTVKTQTRSNSTPKKNVKTKRLQFPTPEKAKNV